MVAAFLAIATFLGNESVKEAIQGQTKVSDAHAEQTTFDTQDEIFQFGLLNLTVFSEASDPTVKAGAKAGIKSLNKAAEGIPEERKRLEERLSENKKEVSQANDQHLLYELAEVLLQIAIVLASVAIIARRRFLLFGSDALAVVGVVILVIGYTT